MTTVGNDSEQVGLVRQEGGEENEEIIKPQRWQEAEGEIS